MREPPAPSHGCECRRPRTCRMTQCPISAATSRASSATTSCPCPRDTLCSFPLSMVNPSFFPEGKRAGSAWGPLTEGCGSAVPPGIPPLPTLCGIVVKNTERRICRFQTRLQVYNSGTCNSLSVGQPSIWFQHSLSPQQEAPLRRSPQPWRPLSCPASLWVYLFWMLPMHGTLEQGAFVSSAFSVCPGGSACRQHLILTAEFCPTVGLHVLGLSSQQLMDTDFYLPFRSCE